jgi:hypothetical protein
MKKTVTISYEEYNSLVESHEKLREENQEYRKALDKEDRVILVERIEAPYLYSRLSVRIEGDEDRIKQYGFAEAKRLAKDLEALKSYIQRVQKEKQELEKKLERIDKSVLRFVGIRFSNMFNS